VFDEYIRINETDIAGKCKLSVSEVKDILLRIAKSGVISYIPQCDSPGISFTEARTEYQNIRISKEIYSDRKNIYEKRIDTMINYVLTSNQCRSEFLLKYFNEQITRACGICDICRQYHHEFPNQKEYKRIHENVKLILSSQALCLQQLVNSIQIPGVSEKKVLKAIDWLKENEIIEFTADHKLFWRSF
jgi:ATP-dependent DNA helicase RecQ